MDPTQVFRSYLSQRFEVRLIYPGEETIYRGHQAIDIASQTDFFAIDDKCGKWIICPQPQGQMFKIDQPDCSPGEKYLKLIETLEEISERSGLIILVN
jgi:hypothetical protein